MLPTLTTTLPQAADLGFLLHTHPDKAQSFPVSAGTAPVFCPRLGPPTRMAVFTRKEMPA